MALGIAWVYAETHYGLDHLDLSKNEIKLSQAFYLSFLKNGTLSKYEHRRQNSSEFLRLRHAIFIMGYSFFKGHHFDHKYEH